jgi:hypothetical protein
MRTIRRLYFYAVTLISLEVVLWGLIGLLRSIFSSELVDTANVLAQALALVLVGLPIFLFHWLWVQRTVAKDEEERNAGLRAIFFYGVLLGTFVPVVQNLLALINRPVLGISSISYERAFLGGFQTWQDNLIAIFINALVALYFWNTLKSAWESLNDYEAFSDVRRLYRYLWLFYSLLMTVFGAQQILRYVFSLSVPENLLGDVERALFANGLSLLLVGAPLWIYIWRICQDALSVPAERESNLRLGALYILALGGIITVLSAGGTLLDIVLRLAFGEAMEGYEFIRDIGGPISLGIPLAAVWAYYGGWLKHQISLDENPVRRAGKQRLYSYILSVLGLGAAFIGVTLLLSVIIDLVTSDAFWGNALRSRLTGAIAALAVGLPLWLLTWRPLQVQALSEGDMGDHARRSIIRRSYLYLALFAGVIGGMATAVGLVYLVINTLLTREIDPDFLSQLLNLLQLLVLFVILLLYHLSKLRHDGTQAGQTLEARQRDFPVLVLDPGDEAFVKTITNAMSKYAPEVPVLVQPLDKRGKPEDAKAIILPASLALNPTPLLRKRLSAFDGKKIIVAEAVPGWVLTALTPEQAAQSARQAAEGDEVQLPSPSPIWKVVQIAAVVILGLQILFFLFVLGISVVVG